MKRLEIGSKVGARRWPDSHAHPDCWGRPWSGTLLALDDVRAWEGTIAFPGAASPDKVRAHVAACLAQGLLKGSVPVLWDFGIHSGKRVHWERRESVRPWKEDLIAWFKARSEAYLLPAGSEIPDDETAMGARHG